MTAWPLYTYAKDKKAGDGVDGAWHAAKAD
ncbi:hypothetical protein [Kaistia granuli]